MKMTKEQVARVAKNILTTLEENKLTTAETIGEAVDGGPLGDQIDEAHGGEEYVEINAHPVDPSAVIVHYLRRIGQEPMQILIRPEGCKVVLTCTVELEGYTEFDEEPDLGKMQDQKFPNFAAVIEELKRLAA